MELTRSFNGSSCQRGTGRTLVPPHPVLFLGSSTQSIELIRQARPRACWKILIFSSFFLLGRHETLTSLRTFL